MTTQHTPGPWRLSDDGFILASDYEGDGKPGIARIVADCKTEKYGTCHTKAEANARLIVAAPVLYEIVRELASSGCYELDGPGSEGSDGCRVCNAGKIIASIEGGE